MKRARNSRLPETQIGPGPSITDLPSAALGEILLKLPVKSIVMCKSVCKAWYGSISDPGFAKLHSGRRANSCVLIRADEAHFFSRSLYFVEPGGDGGCLDSGYCDCAVGNEGCGRCRSDTIIDLKLKIPLRNARVMLDAVGEATFCLAEAGAGENLVRMESREDHYYEVVNSCNGFLCLAGKEKPAASLCICNPITGEFVRLPNGCSRGNDGVEFNRFGFGFSPKRNQYKVVRMSTSWKLELGTDTAALLECGEVAEIHTLGTDSWRSLDISGFEQMAINWPSYLNGYLYWTSNKIPCLMGQTTSEYSLASFDLDSEQFHADLIPPVARQQGPYLSALVLEGRLLAYTKSALTHVEIWLVDKCGASFSWTRLFSIDQARLDRSHEKYHRRLIRCVNDEAAVLLGRSQNEIFLHDESHGSRFKQLKFRGLTPKKFEVIVGFTPSFVSLKDALIPGGNIEVLNVNAGCGKLKLLEETYTLLLGKSREP